MGVILFIYFYLSSSNDSEIKSFEGKIIEKEKVEEKINTIIKLNDLNLSSFNSNHIYNKEHLNSFYNFTMNFLK